MAETTKTTKKDDELVEVMIPLTRDKQDDVPVIVNGQSFYIQRGQRVKVPVYVKEVLDNMERMDNLALTRQRELVAKSKI